MRNLVLLLLALVAGSQCCDEGWVEIEGSCFNFYMGSTFDWSAGRDYCRSLGGDLAKISSSEGHRMAYEYIKTYNLPGSYWLGGSDLVVEGDWLWSLDGQRINMGTPFWALVSKLIGGYQHEPDGGSSQNCLVMDAGRYYYFNDEECSNAHHVICRK